MVCLLGPSCIIVRGWQCWKSACPLIRRRYRTPVGRGHASRPVIEQQLLHRYQIAMQNTSGYARSVHPFAGTASRILFRNPIATEATARRLLKTFMFTRCAVRGGREFMVRLADDSCHSVAGAWVCSCLWLAGCFMAFLRFCVIQEPFTVFVEYFFTLLAIVTAVVRVRNWTRRLRPQTFFASTVVQIVNYIFQMRGTNRHIFTDADALAVYRHIDVDVGRHALRQQVLYCCDDEQRNVHAALSCPRFVSLCFFCDVDCPHQAD